MKYFQNNPRAVQAFEPGLDVIYSADEVEHLTTVPRRTILIYCRHGLISTALDPVKNPEWSGYYFNHEAIQTVRYIAHLQFVCGVNLTGIKLILNLAKEIKGLRSSSLLGGLNQPTHTLRPNIHGG
jgi:DNA-binding transcriptional MerR regulator